MGLARIAGQSIGMGTTGLTKRRFGPQFPQKYGTTRVNPTRSRFFSYLAPPPAPATAHMLLASGGMAPGAAEAMCGWGWVGSDGPQGHALAYVCAPAGKPANGRTLRELILEKRNSLHLYRTRLGMEEIPRCT